MDLKEKKTLKLIFLGIGIIFVGYLLIVSIKNLYSKYEYYKISNTKFETLYSKRRDDIKQIDFRSAILEKDNYQIIDIREKEEYEIGHIPGAKRIRVGDLVGDDHTIDEIKKLNTSLQNTGKRIVFLCHDGDRATEIASFYKDNHGIEIYAIKGGVFEIQKNRNNDQNIWQGEFDFKVNYLNQYKVLQADEIKSDYLINISYDMKNEAKPDTDKCFYNEKDPILAKSIYAPIRNLPTKELNQLFEKIKGKSITTICYSKGTCFYSKLLGYRTTQLGGKFDGIYLLKGSNCADENKPF